MMLYKNKWEMKTDFFEIVAEVLQEDILASYLSILCLDNVLRMLFDLIKENGFIMTKTKNIQYL